MKYLFFFILLFAVLSNIEVESFPNQEKRKTYLVTEIDSVNNWYIVYASDQIKKYKIISKKEKRRKCRKIVKGGEYELVLHSRRSNPPKINGVKILPQNYLDIQCYSYDTITEICLEKDITDLYHSQDLIGICIK